MALGVKGTGIWYKLFENATSSGTQSRRIIFKAPFSQFGVSALLASSSQAAACTVTLYGSAAPSTAAKYGTALVTWSTDDGVVAYSTGPIPVIQVWGELTTNTSSGATNAWVCAVP